MNRRWFLGMAAGTLSLAVLPAPAGADQEGKKGLRLSITWGMLGGKPVGEALALLNRLGYDAYEMFDWRNPRVLETFVAERKKSPLFCACLVANFGVTAPGCGLVNPREHERFLRELEASIEPARKDGLPPIGGSDGKRTGRRAAFRADGERGFQPAPGRAHAGEERHHRHRRDPEHLCRPRGLLSLFRARRRRVGGARGKPQRQAPVRYLSCPDHGR